MIGGCEYREICEAYKIYSSRPKLPLYVWLTNNCDEINIGICVNREKFKEENKLEKEINPLKE